MTTAGAGAGVVGITGGGGAPQFNVVGQGGANQLAQSLGNQEQQACCNNTNPKNTKL